jgi:hypothetical protein
MLSGLKSLPAPWPAAVPTGAGLPWRWHLLLAVAAQLLLAPGQVEDCPLHAAEVSALIDWKGSPPWY